MQQINTPGMLEKMIDSCGLQQHFTRDLAQFSVLMQTEPKEVVIHRGEVSPYLYFLVKGRVRFALNDAGSRSFSHGYARVGDCIGEVGSLWGKPPQVSVLAVSSCLFVAIELKTYREDLLNDKLFLRFVCARLADSVLKLNQNIIKLSQSSASSRVAACLLCNAKDDQLTISLIECARQTAISYRHLIRIMNRFLQDGVLEKVGRKYRIADRRFLMDLADAGEGD